MVAVLVLVLVLGASVLVLVLCCTWPISARYIGSYSWKLIVSIHVFWESAVSWFGDLLTYFPGCFITSTRRYCDMSFVGECVCVCSLTCVGLGSSGTPIGNGIWGMEWRHVTRCVWVALRSPGWGCGFLTAFSNFCCCLSRCTENLGDRVTLLLQSQWLIVCRTVWVGDCGQSYRGSDEAYAQAQEAVSWTARTQLWDVSVHCTTSEPCC